MSFSHIKRCILLLVIESGLIVVPPLRAQPPASGQQPSVPPASAQQPSVPPNEAANTNALPAKTPTATIVIKIHDRKNVEYESLVITATLDLEATIPIQQGTSASYSGPAHISYAVRGNVEEATVNVSSKDTALMATFTLKTKDDCFYEVEQIIAPGRDAHTCWASATAMMLSWRDGVPYTPQQAANMSGADFQSLLNANASVGDENLDHILTPLGITSEVTEYGRSQWTVGDLRDMMRQYGPLMVFRGPGQSELVVEVIKEISGDGTPEGSTISYNSGFTGREDSFPAEQYLSLINDTRNFMKKINHFKQKAKSPCPDVSYEGEGNLTSQSYGPIQGSVTAPDASTALSVVGDAGQVTVTAEGGSATADLVVNRDGVIPISVSVRGGVATVVILRDVGLTFTGTAEVIQPQK